MQAVLATRPPPSSWLPTLVNFVVFQLAWFACVGGAAHGQALLGTAAVGLAMAVHLWRAPRWRPEAALIVLAMLIGVVWESILVNADLLRYHSGVFAAGIAPYWIIASWGLFATTLNQSMRWLKVRHGLAALLGAVAGPASFWGGERMGALQFSGPYIATAVLAVGWSVLTPWLLTLADRFDGFRADGERVQQS